MTSVRQTLREARLIVRNDLRLFFRYSKGNFGRGTMLILAIVVLHAVTIPLCLFASHPPSPAIEGAFWTLVAIVMLGTTIVQATKLLFEETDFPLLLASPISQPAVLLARMATPAAGALLGVAWIVIPVVDGAIIGFGPRYLAAYPTVFLLAWLVAAVGIAATLTLVRMIGARRTRVAAQVFGSVLGVVLYLSFQLPNYLAPEHKAVALRMLHTVVGNPLSLAFARAGHGEPAMLAALTVATAGVALLTSRRMARVFIGGLQEAGSTEARPSHRAKAHHWRSGVFKATLLKDARLILRDPLILSQLLPTLMYMLPFFYVTFQHTGIAMLAPAAVAFGALFSQQLTQVAVAGEECWDLIRMCPTPELKMRAAKVGAGMLGPLILVTGCALALAIAGRPGLSLLTFVTAFATAAACSWMQASEPKPKARRDVLKRGRREWTLSGMATLMLAMLSATGIGLVGAGNTVVGWTVLAAAAAAIAAIFAFVEMKEIAFAD